MRRRDPEPPLLSLTEVDVPFGPRPGLAGISFDLHRGDRLALLGTSGVGKSSLLAAIAEPGPEVGGTLMLGGRSLRSDSAARRQVVLLDQRPLLFPHLSVAGNVAFPLDVRGVTGATLDQRVHRMLERVRMEELGKRAPSSLSGGQAHRVALARALAAEPDLLLLDEPFTGLDPELRSALQDAVVHAASEMGITTITVTHDVREIGRMADRVAVLEGRRVARLTTPFELFLDPGSASVAELLGWPNRMEVQVAAGRVSWHGMTLPVPTGTLGEGAYTLVFPLDGATLVPPGEGHLDVQVDRVDPAPDGATARWRAPGDLDAEAADSTERGRSTPEPDLGSGEVAVDPLAPPTPTARMGLQLRPGRTCLYPAQATTR